MYHYYYKQQLTDKCQKTSCNQSTKFHQLQALFGHQGANNKDIANLQNNLLSGSTASSRHSSMENLTSVNGENEVGALHLIIYLSMFYILKIFKYYNVIPLF